MGFGNYFCAIFLILCSDISYYAFNICPMNHFCSHRKDVIRPFGALRSSIPQFSDSSDWVERMTRQALAGLHQQYPHKVDHLWVENDGSLKSPDALHPAFYGNYDWHSSVHSHWALVRILVNFPEEVKSLHETVLLTLEQSINVENCKVEATYLEGSATFERPYGWGWLLRLSAECILGSSTAQHSETREALARMNAALTPVAQAIRNSWLRYLPKLGAHEPPDPAAAQPPALQPTPRHPHARAALSLRATEPLLSAPSSPLGMLRLPGAVGRALVHRFRAHPHPRLCRRRQRRRARSGARPPRPPPPPTNDPAF
jgi:hypothetical protein